MKHSFREQRLCAFKANVPSSENEPDVSSPKWNLDDLPEGATFRIDDRMMSLDGRLLVKGETRQAFTSQINENGSVEPTRSTIHFNNNPEVGDVTLPLTLDIRRQYDSVLRRQTPFQEPPAFLVKAKEAEAIAEADEARFARLDGVKVHGLKGNPLDRFRDSIEWKEVPVGSFFCLRGGEPLDSDVVYVRQAGDYVRAVGTFEQWRSSVRSMQTPEQTQSDLPTRENMQLQKVIDRRNLDGIRVTVLSVPTPQEYDEILQVVQQRPDARPVTDNQREQWAANRAQMAAFWNRKNQKTA